MYWKEKAEIPQFFMEERKTYVFYNLIYDLEHLKRQMTKLFMSTIDKNQIKYVSNGFV